MLFLQNTSICFSFSDQFQFKRNTVMLTGFSTLGMKLESLETTVTMAGPNISKLVKNVPIFPLRFSGVEHSTHTSILLSLDNIVKIIIIIYK